jgi:hypothetical protein
MRNAMLHALEHHRPSGCDWIADPRAAKSCGISMEVFVNKGAPSSLSLQRAVILGQRIRAAGARGSGRPAGSRDVSEVVRMQFEVLRCLTATTCVPVRPRDSGSCYERDRTAVHAHAFARGTR